MKTQLKILATFVVLGSGLTLLGSGVSAATCTFTRTLAVGDSGEDVRCLQQYLNSNGYVITSTGAGSPGHETGSFGQLTVAALTRWQTARGISPATGAFGPLSRAGYANATNDSTPSSVTPAPTQPDSSALQTALQEKVRQIIKNAHKYLDDTRDDIGDSKNSTDVNVANTMADRAEAKLMDALYAFVDNEYDSAASLASRALDYAKDAREQVNGDGEEAQKALDDASDAIDEARSAISRASNRGKNVSDARSSLSDAVNKFDDAQDAYDNEEYSSALSLAKRALQYAQDAEDALP
jgi:peptidoglycan hydrolase-like protein with peptidoglycan-binding domain